MTNARLRHLVRDGIFQFGIEAIIMQLCLWAVFKRLNSRVSTRYLEQEDFIEGIPPPNDV